GPRNFREAARTAAGLVARDRTWLLDALAGPVTKCSRLQQCRGLEQLQRLLSRGVALGVGNPVGRSGGIGHVAYLGHRGFGSSAFQKESCPLEPPPRCRRG